MTPTAEGLTGGRAARGQVDDGLEDRRDGPFAQELPKIMGRRLEVLGAQPQSDEPRRVVGLRRGRLVVALDATADLMEQAREKHFADEVNWAIGNGYNLPFPDRCFGKRSKRAATASSSFRAKSSSARCARLACQRVRPRAPVTPIES